MAGLLSVEAEATDFVTLAREVIVDGDWCRTQLTCSIRIVANKEECKEEAQYGNDGDFDTRLIDVEM